MGVRAIFGGISAMWRGLSQGQRNAWNNATIDYPYQNKLGDTKNLSGFALHQKQNRNLALAGAAAILSPVSPVYNATPLGLNLTNPGAGLLKITADLDITTAPGRVIVYATGPLSAGVNNFQTRLRVIGSLTQVQLRAGLDITAMYTASFGAPTIGAKVGVQVINIATQTGQASVPVVASVVVTI